MDTLKEEEGEVGSLFIEDCYFFNPGQMTSKPTTVQIKSKTDPEALLNDLSASLKTFSSTVRTWTEQQNSSDAFQQTSFTNFNETRQPRLGLGAKPVKTTIGTSLNANGSVSTNLALKQQLTNSSKNRNEIMRVEKQRVHSRKHGKEMEDESSGGRASMIKKKK